MWKYQCKKQLLFILSGFLFGAFLFGVLQFQNDNMQEILKEIAVSVASMIQDTDANELYEMFVGFPLFIPLLGGVTVAGVVNGISLFFYLVQRFQLNYIYVLILLFLGVGNLAYQIGSILLLPSIFVYIFGWLTIPKGAKIKNKSNVAEIEHVYTIHHQLLPDYKKLAKNIARNMIIMNTLLSVGAILVIFLILYVQDFSILLLGMLLFLCLSFYINKKKSVVLQPVLALLYEKCDPQACASTIFYVSKYLWKRKKFVLSPVLSQCMIYLNDPHLAIDVLALEDMQGKKGVQHTYHALMSYAYYQLGDRSMVQHHYDTLEREVQKMKKTPFFNISMQSLYAISNKLRMLDQDFRSAQQFYQRMLKTTPFISQKVDANYYLGLIAFVQKDLAQAKSAFEFVIQHGNALYFVNKAKHYVKTIQELNELEVE